MSWSWTTSVEDVVSRFEAPISTFLERWVRDGWLSERSPSVGSPVDDPEDIPAIISAYEGRLSREASIQAWFNEARRLHPGFVYENGDSQIVLRLDGRSFVVPLPLTGSSDQSLRQLDSGLSELLSTPAPEPIPFPHPRWLEEVRESLPLEVSSFSEPEGVLQIDLWNLLNEEIYL